MKRIVITGVALLFAAGFTVRLSAAEVEQTTKPWVSLKHVQTEKQFGEIPDGATVAMACSKCKSVMVISQQWKTTKPGQGTIEKALSVHQCPGCGATMTTSLKQSKMVHTCAKCGSNSAFCCATGVTEKTPGM